LIDFSWFSVIRAQVVKFNGEFFRRKTVLPMRREEIGELRQAASYNWRDVDPSIFGTLLEQALNKDERRKLGAHYTPRAYFERLVIATIIEPLRDDWNHVLGTIERKRAQVAKFPPLDPRRESALADARKLAEGFHKKLDPSTAKPLKANDGICSPGVKLHGSGFIVTPQEASHLGLGRWAGLEHYILKYRNGRDLTSRPRGVMVIDLFGLTAEEVRERFPEVYQHLRLEVKEKTITKDDGKIEYVGRDWNKRESYKTLWWIFGEPREEIRPALSTLNRYIVTPVTQKHRNFEFVSDDALPDDALMVFAIDDPFHVGVFQSYAYSVWFDANSSTLENRPRFIKSRCFDPFPFPAADDLQKQRIRADAEDLDAHRKRVLAEHPHLTLTGLYNVLEKLRSGVAPEALDGADRRIFDDGLVLILKEYHDKLDALVAGAYGWPADLPDEEILFRLVALNIERAQEEARGHVRWLRPEYQIPRFGSPKDKAELDLVGGAMGAEAAATVGPKPAFPSGEVEQTAAVMAALAATGRALDASALAAGFKQGRRVAPKIAAVLAALARMGFVASADGGATFSLRRAA
jgi:hypothetical protein